MINNLDTNLFFEAIFYNARHNSMIIMDVDGKILKINEAFTLGFGYAAEDIEGQSFEVLFTPADRNRGKPKTELALAKSNRSANDENYLVHKNGTAVWVTGECIAIGKDDIKWLVKIVHNINAAKQLEKFLEEAEEFIESIFDSVNESGLLMLDLGLKVIKVNKTFLDIFNLAEMPAQGTKVGSLHPFWNDAKVKECLRDILIKNKALKECLLEVEINGATVAYQLDSKMITDNTHTEKRLLIVVHENNAQNIPI